MQNGGIGTPMYLIIKQAYDVGLHPTVPMLISYDAPARPEYWKTLGEKGTWASFIGGYPNVIFSMVGHSHMHAARPLAPAGGHAWSLAATTYRHAYFPSPSTQNGQ